MTGSYTPLIGSWLYRAILTSHGGSCILYVTAKKTVRIRNISGPHFPASECEKMRAKKILNTDTFLGVYFYVISFSILQIHVNKIFFWWKRWSSCKRLILLVPLISLVIRQKGEWQNVCFKKTKHPKFSEKRTFLTSWFFRLFKSLYSWRLHDECA